MNRVHQAQAGPAQGLMPFLLVLRFTFLAVIGLTTVSLMLLASPPVAREPLVRPGTSAEPCVSGASPRHWYDDFPAEAEARCDAAETASHGPPEQPFFGRPRPVR